MNIEGTVLLDHRIMLSRTFYDGIIIDIFTYEEEEICQKKQYM